MPDGAVQGILTNLIGGTAEQTEALVERSQDLHQELARPLGRPIVPERLSQQDLKPLHRFPAFDQLSDQYLAFLALRADSSGAHVRLLCFAGASPVR